MIRLEFLLTAFLLLTVPANAQTPLPALADTERAGWAAVGRINIAGYKDRSFCTGTLVAPTKVLTAAHCVISDGAPRALARMTFVAGWDKGDLLTFRRIKALDLHPAFPLNGERHSAHNDLAVLTLDKAIEPRQLAALPVQRLIESSGTYAILGYHRKRPNVLNGRFDCLRTGRNALLLALDCPVIEGNSGAPVLRLIDNNWRVVAVVSARPKEDGKTGAITTLVDDWARKQIATQPGL